MRSSTNAPAKLRRALATTIQPSCASSRATRFGPYLSSLAGDVRPVSVERRFELRFDGAKWSVVGYLDVEDERGIVIDVKLGAKHNSDARAARDPQPSLYLLAASAEGREARFEFHPIRRGPIRSGRSLRERASPADE
jgi:hypothetical protein